MLVLVLLNEIFNISYTSNNWKDVAKKQIVITNF